MKLLDFLVMIKKRKIVFLGVMLAVFVGMAVFTVFFNKVSYDISATIKLDGNEMLITGTETMINDKYLNSIEAQLRGLDDQAAMEYVENRKHFYDDTSMVNYQEVMLKLNSVEYANAIVNSYSFKLHLVEQGVIQKPQQINIVAQTESLSIRITAQNSAQTQEIYDAVLTEIPRYVAIILSGKIEQVSLGLTQMVDHDKAEIEQLLIEYAQVRSEPEFTEIENISKGVELLNRISRLSHDVEINNSVAHQFERLLTNDISPEVIVEKVNLDGLKITETLVTYIIVEFIASILIGLLVVFLCECSYQAKKIVK